MAEAIITLGEPYQHSPLLGGPAMQQSVTAKCSECGHMVFTGGPVGRDWSGLLAKHLQQHEPGRALDLEVSYELVADCTVCEDGGKVEQEGETIICRACNTTWYEDGTGGERADG